jgi:hypothetical protein
VQLCRSNSLRGLRVSVSRAERERRQATRYALNAPVSFSWEKPGHVYHQAAGVTRDICEKGIFVLTDMCPPPDAALQIEVCFPAVGNGTTVQMLTRARVLRLELVDGGKTPGGFAVFCKSFALRNRKRMEAN